MTCALKRQCLLSSLVLAVAVLVLPAAVRADDDHDGKFKVVEATIADIQDAFRNGDLSPEDLVEIYLDRIAAFDQSAGQPLNGGAGNQPLNAFMHVNESPGPDNEGEGDGRGRPLFGIPVILKDNVATKDMPTTAGSVALGNSRPKKDATIAAKLRRAGAIILGKGTLTEFANFIALGMPTGFSSQLRFQLFEAGGDLSKVGFGFNSYDPRIDPRNVAPVNDGRPVLATGGSSSGPGIAVGANLATVGVGTETSGSILSPSGQNSLVGIKPTLGLVSRNGIVPITADQDTAGPMARTVTDAAKLLGVLAGFDENDSATRDCLTRGNCFSDYTQFLNKNALQGAHIAVPKHPYWIEFGLGAARTALIQAAIDKMTTMGATFETCEIPSQNVLNNYGTCVTAADVAARRATPAGAIPPCSTVLMFGFKRDLNSYLANKDFGPGVSAAIGNSKPSTTRTLADVVAFNDAHPEVAEKYGQAIAVGSNILDTTPGSIDERNYQADRALDLKLTRTCGLDVLYTGKLPAECAGLVTDQGSCTGKKFDAVLFPANFGANAPARAGFPSVIVPAGFFQPTLALLPAGFTPNKSPFGVTFSGPRFSEPRLIGFAFAFEQATHFRVPPASAPELASH
ncbi:MAG TPA: amidase family protein [Myxococcales bacterium]|nr:amidase family protein [Myxococcales bacterium]